MAVDNLKNRLKWRTTFSSSFLSFLIVEILRVIDKLFISLPNLLTFFEVSFKFILMLNRKKGERGAARCGAAIYGGATNLTGCFCCSTETVGWRRWRNHLP